MVRLMNSRYAGVCGDCGEAIEVGDPIAYGGRGRVVHADPERECSLEKVPAGPTTRERKEARVERLRGWSDSRAARSEAASAAADSMASVIPFGQPILVGHYSEGRDRRYRGRIVGHMDKAVEHHRKSEEMAGRADNIEAAADRAIYSDDIDAIERLEARIAELEGERDRWKLFNKRVRAAKGEHLELDLAVLDAKQRADYLSTARVASYSLGKFGQAPGYHVTNLTGNIARQRKRLQQLQREASSS